MSRAERRKPGLRATEAGCGAPCRTRRTSRCSRLGAPHLPLDRKSPSLRPCLSRIRIGGESAGMIVRAALAASGVSDKKVNNRIKTAIDELLPGLREKMHQN